MPSGGHNEKFSPENAQFVIMGLHDGKSLTEIARELGVDRGTISKWRDKYPAFETSVLRAMEEGYDAQADSLKDIAEKEQDVHRARLMCDNIKWRLARRAAHKYGDRIDVNVTQTVDISGALADARARVLPIRDQRNVIDGELIETKQLIVDSATDYISVGGEPAAPESGDDSEAVDIFG